MRCQRHSVTQRCTVSSVFGATAISGFHLTVCWRASLHLVVWKRPMWDERMGARLVRCGILPPQLTRGIIKPGGCHLCGTRMFLLIYADDYASWECHTLWLPLCREQHQTGGISMAIALTLQTSGNDFLVRKWRIILKLNAYFLLEINWKWLNSNSKWVFFSGMFTVAEKKWSKGWIE